MDSNTPKPNSEASLTQRREYIRGVLTEADLNSDPLEQFNIWYNEALANNIEEANAMALATSDLAGKPTVRFVLLKGHDLAGFRFYTNYDSAKAQDLNENPRASITIYWRELERQVRIEGNISRLAEHESDQYFNSRPRSAQIGACASLQSQVLDNRKQLEESFAAVEKKYPDGSPIPRPKNWGGFILKPTRYEFWQGRVGRMHDRFEFVQINNAWISRRLYP